MQRGMDEELRTLRRLLQQAAALSSASMDAVCAHLAGKEAIEAQATEIEERLKRVKSDVEALSLRLLLLRQPVAGDLRRVRAALSVIVDFSRVAEQARHVAELANDFSGYDKPAAMAGHAAAMVRSAGECYLTVNPEGAANVIADDDTADRLYREIKADLVERLKISADDWVLDCLLVTKYLERIADHAVRIAGCTRELL